MIDADPNVGRHAAKYAALFLSESRDNIAALNDALLILERAPAPEEAASQIDRAFRAVHTMKGMAGAMGHAHVVDIAHAMESLLAIARGGTSLLTPAQTGILFEGADALEHTIEAIAAGSPAVDLTNLCERLVAAASDPQPLSQTQTRAVIPEPVASPEAESSSDPSVQGPTPDQPPVAPKAATETAKPDGAWQASVLRVPLQQYVRIDLQRLDSMMNLIGELVIARGRLAGLVTRYAEPELDDAMLEISRLVADLQQGILSSRMVPVWHVFDRFPRVVRDAARTLDKEIDLVLEGRDIELDRSILEHVSDPLVHLLRNAIDHGIEAPAVREAAGKPRAGRLTLSAIRDRSAVVIRVTDDGRGIDRPRLLARSQAEGAIDEDRTELNDDEVLRLIARPGFSTAERVTDLSGRGVGMDAVVSRVRALGGSVDLRSEQGKGTSLSLRLPVTLAIIPSLLAQVERETYVLPLTHVRETLKGSDEVVRRIRGKDVLLLRDEVLPLLSLREIVGVETRDPKGGQIVVLEVADRRAGLVVDELVGRQEVVVKPFDAARGATSCFSGATILSDGAPALILEATSLV